MKEYNYDEIQKMQEKALERVRDMQIKTRQIVNGEQEEKEKGKEQKAYRENFYNAVKSAPKADYIKMPVEMPEEIKDYESFEKYFSKDSKEETNKPLPEVSNNTSNAVNPLIDGLANEPDKALLLSLLLLLQSDNADEELLMTLLYIML